MPDDQRASFYLPEAISTLARDVDQVYYFVYWVCVFFFVLIVTIMVFFVIRYRRRDPNETTPRFTHNMPLELAWTILPCFLIVAMFLWGFDKYMKMRVSPHGALEIQVTAEQWRWTFTYPDGTVTGELGVPVNQPIKLVMNSHDVIHSFFVPHFRQKMDVIPNRYTTTWFEAVRTGEYPIFCAEYCGTEHSSMLSTVIVMDRPEYDEWLLTGGLGDLSALPPADLGRTLYERKVCITCHSIDGSPKTGPTFLGIFGHEVTLSDGSTVTVDENYIRQSIVNPSSQIVQGYQDAMPPYAGQLTDQHIDGLIAFIRSLSDEAGATEPAPTENN